MDWMSVNMKLDIYRDLKTPQQRSPRQNPNCFSPVSERLSRMNVEDFLPDSIDNEQEPEARKLAAVRCWFEQEPDYTVTLQNESRLSFRVKKETDNSNVNLSFGLLSGEAQLRQGTKETDSDSMVLLGTKTITEVVRRSDTLKVYLDHGDTYLDFGESA